MIWIIPMAGNGTRTKELGEFKPFILIAGKKMINWLLLSIHSSIKTTDKVIFITTRYFSDKYRVSNEIDKLYSEMGLTNFHFVKIVDSTPEGSAKTVYSARDLFKSEEPVAVVNCDQFIDFKMVDNVPDNTGYMTVYAEFTNKSGYVEIENGEIKRLIEKNNISNIASAGVFIFPTGNTLIKSLELMFSNQDTLNGEYYLSRAVNYLISLGNKVLPIPVSAKFDLGNYEGIKEFSQMIYKCKTYEQN